MMMLSVEKRVNYIAILSMCWGFLLTSIAFISIVWSAREVNDVEEGEHFTLKLICQAAILALGSIQTVFSIVLYTTSKSMRESWTTIWICSHIVVILGLIFFYILQTTYTSLVTSSTADSSWSPGKLTTLDAAVLFDFLFLTIFFLSILCESPGSKPVEELTPTPVHRVVPSLSEQVSQNPGVLLSPQDLWRPSSSGDVVIMAEKNY